MRRFRIPARVPGGARRVDPCARRSAAEAAPGKARSPFGAGVVVCVAALVVGACGGARAPAAAGPAPASAQPAVVAPTASLDFGGQKVLILPVQRVEGTGTRDEATGEVVFALRERDTRTQWVAPDQLRRALRATPGYAVDPGALPDDSFMHFHERSIADPLASVVRRYSALTDARVVIIPRAARWVADAGGTAGRVRMTAAVVDARSGRALWYGDVDGEPAPTFGRGALASAAAALAERMVSPEGR
jgi:hypothetical protein